MSIEDNNITVECTEDNIIIECPEEDIVVELKDYVTFWATILGKPSSNQALVNYLDSLLATKQDLTYYVVATESDKDLIEDKKTGTVAFVKATKNLYIYYSEGSTTEWIMLIRDLSNYYTKTETDALLALKANIADVYSKIESDARFATITNLSAEAQARTQADTTLQTNIDNEESARISADSSLSSRITNEATTRASEDTSIRESIKNGKLTIQKNGTTIAEFYANQSGNTTANILADTPAWGNISGNIQTQTDLQQEFATKANQSALTNEINDRQEADADLQEEINDLTEVVDTKVTKNSNITGATKTKITYDSKGLVTAGTDLSASDIPNLTLSKISDVTASASEVNVLDGITATTQELNYTDGVTSNIQTQINSKLNITDVINNVTTTTTNQALSANMGKELQDQITNLKQRGRYLSIWNSTTGLATTTPTVNPYTYKAGDYFIVGVVGSTNYRPSGSTYDKDVPSTTVETGDVVLNDTYYYDGTTWSLLHTSQPTVAFSTLAGSPYDNANLTTALNAKQATLSEGTGISLSSNTVSINQVATEGYNINITGTLTTLNGVLSGFSSIDYATIPVQLSPTDDSWEAVFKFTTASSKPSRYRYLLGSLQGQNSIVIGQYSTGVLTYWLSSQGGNNWDICSDQRGTIVLSDSTTYTVSVAYDGQSVYTMSISTNDGVSWTQDTTVTSSSDIYGGTLYLGSPYDRSNDTCWQGSIDLNNCRMKIGRQGEIWAGFSTVENIAKATENLYGLVKPDNSTITVSDGVISASPAVDNTTISINASDQLQAVNLVGLTSTITELNYTDGVTSNIQTQLDSKQASGSYVTTDTDQTITNHKLISFDESSMGSQASLLGVISSQYASSSASWVGRTLIGSKDLTFLMGTYKNIAGIGAHSWTDATTQSGAAWADFYLNPDGNKSVYIGGNDWTSDSGWLKVENSGSTSGGKVYYNKGTTGNTNWKEVTVIDDSSTSATDATWSASKLNTTIGNIETAINAIRGVS